MSDMNTKDFTDASTAPKRQGFYAVELDDGSGLIAEYRERLKAEGKQWWRWAADEPTLEKEPQLLTGVARWRNADKAAIDAALRREPTVAERIEAAVKDNARFYDIYETNATAPPANRQLQPGDAIELGALKDCKVIETRDEGRLVILSYRHLRRERGVETELGLAYRAAHWTQVVPTASNRVDQLVSDPLMYDGYRTSTVSSLMSKQLRGLDDNPDYQRGYVWNAKDKERLLDSLFKGREIGRFIFVNQPYPQPDEILDGKQRMKCLWQFYTSQIAYKGVYWHELCCRDRDRIENRTVQYAELPASRYSKADLLRVFLELNAAGVPQSEEHLHKVRELLAAEELANPPKAA